MLCRYKIAEILCRANLHLSASTVKRCIDEPPIDPTIIQPEIQPVGPTVQAWYSDHVWSIDLTVVPSCDGLWTPWSPNALTQVHPYSWYVMVVIDHFSRRVRGFEVFEQQPTSSQVASAMERICTENGVKSKYLISDQGVQFISNEFKAWCKKNDIKQRFGAIGRHGSIAVTERLHLSMKNECTRRIIAPIYQADFSKEITYWREWYNSYRPHQTLEGKTPDEVYFGFRADRARQRVEARVVGLIVLDRIH